MLNQATDGYMFALQSYSNSETTLKKIIYITYFYTFLKDYEILFYGSV